MTKQVIDIGSAANDGTGDTLRDAMDMVNDNFTENYDAIAILAAANGSPCMGSKYAGFRAAIKYFITNELYQTDLFFVSKIENGVAGHVIIEVSKTSALNTSGTVVMRRDLTTAAKTGWEKVALTAYNSSGLWGIMVIDWDELTAATSYTCANWPEGGLYVVNTSKPATTGGGSNTENVALLTDDAVDVDGTKDQYICEATKDITMLMKAFADILGTVRVNNVSDTYHVQLYAAVAEQATSTFNGVGMASIIIEPLTYVEVMTYSEGVFYVKFPFTSTAP